MNESHSSLTKCKSPQRSIQTSSLRKKEEEEEEEEVSRRLIQRSIKRSCITDCANGQRLPDNILMYQQGDARFHGSALTKCLCCSFEVKCNQALLKKNSVSTQLRRESLHSFSRFLLLRDRKQTTERAERCRKCRDGGKHPPTQRERKHRYSEESLCFSDAFSLFFYFFIFKLINKKFFLKKGGRNDKKLSRSKATERHKGAADRACSPEGLCELSRQNFSPN